MELKEIKRILYKKYLINKNEPYANIMLVLFKRRIILPFSIGLILSLNQIFILYSRIGEGFNEFNKKNGMMKIYRKGFPGKNEDINIVYPLSDILCKYNYRIKN